MFKFNFNPSRFYVLKHEPNKRFIIVEIYQDHLLSNMIKFGGRNFKNAADNHLVVVRYLHFDTSSNSYSIEKALYSIKVNELIDLPFKIKLDLKVNRLLWYFRG